MMENANLARSARSAKLYYLMNRDLRLVLCLKYCGAAHFKVDEFDGAVAAYLKDVWGIELKGIDDIKKRLREWGFEVNGNEVILEDRDKWVAKRLKELAVEGFELMRRVADIGGEIGEMKEIVERIEEEGNSDWKNEHQGLCDSVEVLEGVIRDYKERLKGG